MIWILAFLTGILILDSLFLVLLILVQLPKKEAGLGQAFGGATTDALFGAGSGNALTKLTKYASVIFLALTLVLAILQVHGKNRPSRLQQGLQNTPAQQSTLPGIPAPLPGTSNAVSGTQPQTGATNVAPKPPAPETKPAPSAATPPASPTATNSSTTEKPK